LILAGYSIALSRTAGDFVDWVINRWPDRIERIVESD